MTDDGDVAEFGPSSISDAEAGVGLAHARQNPHGTQDAPELSGLASDQRALRAALLSFRELSGMRGVETIGDGLIEQSLYDAIERDIVPRLMRAHQLPDDQARRSLEALEAACAEAIPWLIGEEPRAPEALIDWLLANGHAPFDILINGLPHVARRLGDAWEDDRLRFADVTIGLYRLHEALRYMVRSLGLASIGPIETAASPSALFVAAAGEQHIFGASVATEVFRYDGWRVANDLSGDIERACGVAASGEFDIIGLSASHAPCGVESLADQIRRFRESSRNPKVKVIVGGPLFAADPELSAAIGADAQMTDAGTASSEARRLLEQSGNTG